MSETTREPLSIVESSTETVTTPCKVCGVGVEYGQDYFSIGKRKVAAQVEIPETCGKVSCVDELTGLRAAAAIKDQVVRDTYQEDFYQRLRDAAREQVYPIIRHDLDKYPLDSRISGDAASRSLFFTGSTGAGKTFQAWLAWLEWAETVIVSEHRSPSAWFFTANELLEKYRRTFNTTKTFTVPLDTLLVIDDLGVENSTPWALTQLNDLINERYYQQAPTIITSNLDLAELSDRYSDRFPSRIAKAYQIIKFSDTDYRLEGAKP